MPLWRKLPVDIKVSLKSSKPARMLFLLIKARDERAHDERGRQEMERDAARLAPSILAADFARLGEHVREAEQAGADRIHVDVMDGHFVRNISMGSPIVASLRTVTRLQIETHLMITDPDTFLEEFVEAGSDSFLVHWEGNLNLHRTVHSITKLGKRAGVAINPATPAAVLEQILPEI